MNKKLLMLLIALLGFGATAKASMGMKIDGTNVTPTVLQNYGITATQTTGSHGTVTGLTLTMTNTTIDATNVGLAITGTDYPVMIQVEGVCTITSSGDAGMTFEGIAYFTGSGTLYIKGTSGIRMLGATVAGMYVDDGVEVIAEGTNGPGLFGYSAIVSSKVPTFYKSLTVQGTGSAFIVKGTTQAIEALSPRTTSLADGYEIKYPAGTTFSSGTQTGTYISTANEWVHITDTGQPINSTNFPDANFLSYVLSNIDIHSDGYLSRYEAWTYETMNIYSSNISDITGLAYFINLKTLNCTANRILKLDVSANTKLTELRCANGNPIDTLDVSMCPNLKTLVCGGGTYPYRNYFKSLNVTGCSQLENLECAYGLLTSLDVSTCTALKLLYCFNHSITSLDVSGLTNLQTCLCRQNSLSSLNVTGCTSLTNLQCNNNPIPSLDLSTCTALQYLWCGSNSQLTSLDVSGLSLEKLDASSCSALTTLNCSNNQLKELTITGSTALTNVNCAHNELDSLAIPAIADDYTLNCSYNQLVKLTLGGNPRSLDCSHNLLPRIPTYYTRLMTLDCSYNQIDTLNISDVSLHWLYCNNNAMSKLGLPLNTQGTASPLYKLDCSNNQLTALTNLAKCTSLTELNCSNNPSLGNFATPETSTLKKINASNTGITYFYHHETSNLDFAQLTSLDLSNCPNLIGVYCDRNELTTLNVTGCTAMTTLGCAYNNLTQLDVSTCTALKYLSLADTYGSPSNSSLRTLDVSGLTSLEKITAYWTGVDTLRAVGCSALKEIDARAAVSVMDLGGCSALETLTCSGKNLSTVDLSDCVALKELSIFSQKLTGLDLSHNSKLETVNCSNNLMSTLTMGNHPHLKTLSCNTNQLTALDVSGCDSLNLLKVYGNQITGQALDALIASLRIDADTTSVIEVFCDPTYTPEEVMTCTRRQAKAARTRGWVAKYWQYSTYPYPLLEVPMYIRGDVDGDGEVTADDVPVLANYLVGKPTDGVLYDEETADVDETGTPSLSDLTRLNNYMLYGEFDHLFVDLGLPSGTLWATTNIGSDTPEATGLYFAWGETTGYAIDEAHTFNYASYTLCNGTDHTLTKYCFDSDYGYEGYTDNLTELETIDDAAYQNWGSGWRIPSKEQYNELMNTSYTDQELTTQNGVYGCKVTSKTNGRSIFLPATGYRNGSTVSSGNYADYGTRTMGTNSPISCQTFSFSQNLGISNNTTTGRYRGHNIRPVRNNQ